MGGVVFLDTYDLQTTPFFPSFATMKILKSEMIPIGDDTSRKDMYPAWDFASNAVSSSTASIMEKVASARQRRHLQGDRTIYQKRSSAPQDHDLTKASMPRGNRSSDHYQSSRRFLLGLVVLIVALLRYFSTQSMPLYAARNEANTNTSNIETQQTINPLKSLNIASADESFQKGFWQRTKPFPLESFHTNVTCKLPVSAAAEEWQRRAPYVLILGSQKGGTTAMAYYLYNHPSIPYLPSKELHFFDEDMDLFPFQTDLSGFAILEAYQQNAIGKEYSLERLQQQTEAHILDATPNYLFASDRVPQRVLCACGPWVKLLVLLRDPVDRAWSQYSMQVQHDLAAFSTTDATGGARQPILSFEEYVDLDMNVLQETGVLPQNGISPDNHAGSPREFQAWQTYTRLGINSPIGRGLYSIQLRHWLDSMKKFEKAKSDLLVLKTERMRDDSKAVYQQVLQFLEMASHDLPSYDKIHETKMLPQNDMKPETRLRLQQFYRPYNRQLKDLLGSDWAGVWESS